MGKLKGGLAAYVKKHGRPVLGNMKKKGSSAPPKGKSGGRHKGK